MNVVCKVRCSVVLALCASISAGTQADTAIAKTAVLTVTGQISKTNEDDVFTFDMTALAALPQHSLTTLTPWYPESHTFTGPLLRDVLSEVGAQGNHVEAIALNGYSSTIPTEDSMYFDVIIARLQDGEPMQIRDKGPLFILYPFDEDEAARSQIYYGRSVWQLKSLNVE